MNSGRRSSLVRAKRLRILKVQLPPRGRSITGAEGSACAGTRFPTAQAGNGHTGEPGQLFHLSWRFLHLISAGRSTAFTRHMQSELMRGAGRRVLGGSCTHNAISVLSGMEGDRGGLVLVAHAAIRIGVFQRFGLSLHFAIDQFANRLKSIWPPAKDSS